jgi:hypothetical protein
MLTHAAVDQIRTRLLRLTRGAETIGEGAKGSPGSSANVADPSQRSSLFLVHPPPTRFGKRGETGVSGVRSPWSLTGRPVERL